MTDLRAILAALGEPGAALTPAGAEKPSCEPEVEHLRKLRILNRVSARRLTDLRRQKNAAWLLEPIPKPGEVLHAIMGGDFHAGDIIPAILDLTGLPARGLVIATLGWNQWNIRQLSELMKAGRNTLGALGARVHLARSHAKIVLIDSPPHAWVAETSANIRGCDKLEHLILADDRELFEFHANWIKGCFPKAP